MKRLIAFISILMLVSVAAGTAVSITIYGTNKSNAQDNVTCYGCNNTISVQAWNTSYVKNFRVNSVNASGDVVSFNISNVTAYQVQEMKMNGTAVNAYQAGANGMLNFSYNTTGNMSFVLSPAPKANGYNFTWAWIWNGGSRLTLHNSTAACDINTVYQNTNTTPIVVLASIIPKYDSGALVQINMSTKNPPNDGWVGTLQFVDAANGGIFPTMFEVPANYYWSIAGASPAGMSRCVIWRR